MIKKAHILLLVLVLAGMAMPSYVLSQKADKKKKSSSKKSSSKTPTRKPFELKNLPEGLSKADSAAFMLKQKNEAAAAERWRILDSTTASRKLLRDSITDWRERRADSIARIAKYKASRKYTDSIARSRQKRTDSIKYERMAKLDDLKELRKDRLDSIVKARKANLSQITKAREATRDSLVKVRKAVTEALVAKRKVTADSLAKVKKVKAELLAKKKKLDLEKLKKGFKTEDEKQMAKAMEAHKKKNAEFSNQKFLKKAFTMNRRIYQNTTTRYNYFYNARNKYNTSIDGQVKGKKVDYQKLLDLNPYNVVDGAAAVGSEMDSVIKKCATSIQIHDPRSKWFDDLFLLQGKAYYAKNDVENAMATFQYITSEYKDKPKKKKKDQYVPRKKVAEADKTNPKLASIERRKWLRKLNHHGVRNDALLWMAKTYVLAESYSDAQSLIAILDGDENFPKRLRPELYLLSAKINIATQSNSVAIENLEKALKTKKLSSTIKQSTNYVLGQLHSLQANYELSNKYFKDVIKLNPNLDMDFYSKVNMARNSAKGDASNLDAVENMFKKIISDGKYTSYLDRAYLALAQVLVSTKPDKAIGYFNKSITTPNATNEVKGEAFLNLGDLYFNQLQYVQSQASYDSALAILPETAEFNRLEIQNRKDVLTDLVSELNVIHQSDSLLELSMKSEKEQKAIAKAAMKLARKAAEKGIEDLENNTNTITNQPKNTITNNASANNSKWYFANTANVKAGKEKFIAKYGNRPNVDEWNRKITLPLDVSLGGEVGSEDPNIIEANGDQEDVSAYLLGIPNTVDKKSNCDLAIENSLYNAAIIYYSGLNDNEKTIEYLERLLNRYPNTDYKQQAYYTLFLANTNLKRDAEASKYQALLNGNFPNSTFAQLASKKTDASSEMAITKVVDKYYSETYDFFQEKNYLQVQSRVAFAKVNYTDSKLIPKFELLDIMTEIALNKIEEARGNLQDLIKANAGSEEATLAQDILALLVKNNATLKDTNSTLENLLPSFDKPGNTNYVYDDKQPHIFMILVRKIDGRLEAMRSGMSDYNTINHSLDKIENTFYLIDQNTGVCVYKQFANEKKARAYMKDVLNNKSIYSVFKASEIDMCIMSTENYELFKNTRNIEGYLSFYKKYYK